MSDQSARPAAQLRRSIGVRDLRAQLATQLTRVEAGETIVVSRDGRPIARLAPLTEPPGPEAGYGLEDMARLGLVERPRLEPGAGSPSGPDSSTVTPRPLPVDVRVDRIVRQVRG